MCTLFPRILQVNNNNYYAAKFIPLSLSNSDNAHFLGKIRACISRFKDCPLCGADIEKTEADTDLQNVVDRFIEGHARIKRPQVNTEGKEVVGEKKTVIYEDVSLERGAFLVQQAMRVGSVLSIEFCQPFNIISFVSGLKLS